MCFHWYFDDFSSMMGTMSLRQDSFLSSYSFNRCPIRMKLGLHWNKLGLRLFADDVVLLASSCCDLQLLLERFTAQWDAAAMRISASKSEAVVVMWKRVEFLQSGKGSTPSRGGEVVWGLLFQNEGEIGEGLVVKEALYHPIYGHELWIVYYGHEQLNWVSSTGSLESLP